MEAKVARVGLSVRVGFKMGMGGGAPAKDAPRSPPVTKNGLRAGGGGAVVGWRRDGAGGEMVRGGGNCWRVGETGGDEVFGEMSGRLERLR